MANVEASFNLYVSGLANTTMLAREFLSELAAVPLQDCLITEGDIFELEQQQSSVSKQLEEARHTLANKRMLAAQTVLASERTSERPERAPQPAQVQQVDHTIKTPEKNDVQRHLPEDESHYPLKARSAYMMSQNRLSGKKGQSNLITVVPSRNNQGYLLLQQV